MRPALLLDDEECAALRALAVERSAVRFRAGDHPPRGIAILRVLGGVCKEVLTLWRGGILDKRLERIGEALVHDHSDRQLSRLLARERGAELGDRVPFGFAGSGTTCKLSATLTLCRNAGRIRLLSGSFHPEVAGVVAKALLVGGVVNASLGPGIGQPRALAISHDLNEVRLLLGFVATRAAIPILIILHDFGASEWTSSSSPWVRALTYDCALVHDAHAVSAMDPPPSSLCIFPRPARMMPRPPEDGLVVGVVVDAFVDPRSTVRMATTLATRSAVRRVLIRRHPRSSAADWAVELPAGVAYANPADGLDDFAREVHVALVSPTTATHQLIRSGLPCMFWDGFDRNRSRDYSAQHSHQGLHRTPEVELSRALGLTLDRLGFARVAEGAVPGEHVPVIGVPELIRRFHLHGVGARLPDSRPPLDWAIK